MFMLFQRNDIPQCRRLSVVRLKVSSVVRFVTLSALLSRHSSVVSERNYNGPATVYLGFKTGSPHHESKRTDTVT
jgi:hypothetical protein